MPQTVAEGGTVDQIDEIRQPNINILPSVGIKMNGSLNHSCDSNLWMADEVTLVARRDILPGEEITVDYALFTTSPEWTLGKLCQCGSPVCRHTITGNDWRRIDVQERYAGHFSPFINERIARLKR